VLQAIARAPPAAAPLASSYASASGIDVCWRRLGDRIRANVLPDGETSGALPQYAYTIEVGQPLLLKKRRRKNNEADVSEFRQELQVSS